MRRTLASPILAISSKRPSTIFAEALSASIRTARRGERGSGMLMHPVAFPHYEVASIVNPMFIHRDFPIVRHHKAAPPGFCYRQDIGAYSARRKAYPKGLWVL